MHLRELVKVGSETQAHQREISTGLSMETFLYQRSEAVPGPSNADCAESLSFHVYKLLLSTQLVLYTPAQSYQLVSALPSLSVSSPNAASTAVKTAMLFASA